MSFKPIPADDLRAYVAHARTYHPHVPADLSNYIASAYAEMFEERTGIEINQIVILVVTEDGIVQEFVKTKHDYLPLLVETIDDFTEHWEKENEMVHSSSNDTAA